MPPVDDIHGDNEGLTPDMERQMKEMEQATSDDAGGMGAPGALSADPPAAGEGADDTGAGGAADAAAAAAAEAAAAALAGAPDPNGATTDDDDDDDDTGDAAEQTEQPGPDGQRRRRKPPRVSLKKFEIEKNRADATAAELAAERAERVRMEERLAIVAQAMQAKKKPEGDAAPVDDDPEPDAENDIFAHNQWLRRQVEKTNKKFDEFVSGQQQRQQVDQEESTLVRNYTADTQNYSVANPDFLPARQFLLESAVVEVALMSFGKDLTDGVTKLTPQEQQAIARSITNYERGIVEAAFAAGQSPASRVHMIAKRRGFKPPEAAPAAGKAAAANGDGKPAANGNGAGGGNGAAAAASAAEQVARIRGGVAGSRSLSDGAGAVAETFDAKKLATMPMEQFESMLNGIEDNEDLMKLFGES